MSWLKMKEAAAKKLRDMTSYETSFKKVELELVEIKYSKNKLTADFQIEWKRGNSTDVTDGFYNFGPHSSLLLNNKFVGISKMRKSEKKGVYQAKYCEFTVCSYVDDERFITGTVKYDMTKHID